MNLTGSYETLRSELRMAREAEAETETEFDARGNEKFNLEPYSVEGANRARAQKIRSQKSF